MGTSSPSALLAALMERRVSAQVTDLDHYRIHGGMAVETDYIITVKPGRPDDSSAVLERRTDDFEAFKLNKTYSAFRTLALQLKKAADNTTSNLSKRESLHPKVRAICRYCELVVHLIDSQRTQYLGKVNYSYVKALAKQRSRIINDALEATLNNFPDEVGSHPLLQEMASAVETFLLTDFCYEEEEVEDPLHHHHHHLRNSSGSGGITTALKIFATPGKRREIFQSSPKKSSSNTSKDFSPPRALRRKESDEPGEEGVEMPADEATDILQPLEQPKTLRSVKSPVVPYTRRVRRSVLVRALDDTELNQVGEDANLLLDDDRPQSELVPSYSRPVPVTAGASTFVSSKWDEWIGNNPTMFMLIGILAIYVLREAAQSTIRMDVDVFLLMIFACYCLGLHTPRPAVSGIDKPAPGQLHVSFVPSQDPDRSGHKLLRRSMAVASPKATMDVAASLSLSDRLQSATPIEEEMEDEPDVLTIGPMAKFPVGAPLGSHHNCWSEPNPADFLVRGAHYLADHKKIPSGDFLFPVRGVDLFLTDACPENVGSNSSVFGGHLRDIPTFIINFRLPWGVLLFYFEIADRFLPFLKARYEADYDKSQLPSFDDMPPGDRTACRFILGDDAHKNHTLKIVPVVVEGPWIVKSVVGGKPAIIGTKLPVKYIYQRQEGKKACYLEADLDIVSSAAARGILSVTRTYTQVLTLDLGFVVQGNKEDELPEQMLVGTRLHGINPLTAPPLPFMKELFLSQVDSIDEDSVSGMHSETRQ